MGVLGYRVVEYSFRLFFVLWSKGLLSCLQQDRSVILLKVLMLIVVALVFFLLQYDAGYRS